MKQEQILEGMKFINQKADFWPYQISGIDGDQVIISWIEKGKIISTLYVMDAVVNHFKNGTWEVIDSKSSVVHTKNL